MAIMWTTLHYIHCKFQLSILICIYTISVRNIYYVGFLVKEVYRSTFLYRVQIKYLKGVKYTTIFFESITHLQKLKSTKIYLSKLIPLYFFEYICCNFSFSCEDTLKEYTSRRNGQTSFRIEDFIPLKKTTCTNEIILDDVKKSSG